MGEFGFITADDVYHVTVYATDENGNFKIVSMKNIKLMKGPAPLPSPRADSTTTSTTPQPFMVKTTVKSEIQSPTGGSVGCASCRIPDKPDTETIKPPTAIDAATEIPPPFKVVTKNEQVTTETPTTVQNEALPQKLMTAHGGNPLLKPRSDAGSAKNNQLQFNNVNQNLLGNRQAPNGRQPALNEKLNSPQMFNKNGGNAEHYEKLEQLMNGLLYRFNYTTDFQGHHETGDRAGNKDGEYYSVGRDNVKQVVSYKANEFGYMPHIRREPINPQELQYYDEKNNKLRGYKFEWFYQ